MCTDRTLAPLAVVLFLFACGDDGGGGRDAGRDAGGGADAGLDAGRDAGGGDAGDAGGADGGADAGDAGADASDDGGADAGEDAALSCCEGGPCPEGEECLSSSCSCGPPPVCTPPCTGGFVCIEGPECVPRCAVFGCSDRMTVCDGESGECIPWRCTSAECFESDQSCDPARGCFDPCVPPEDWAECTARGGRCYLGGCVEDSCATLGETCVYKINCCGNNSCVAESAEPECPFDCEPELEPPADPAQCACHIEGGCIDLRFGGR